MVKKLILVTSPPACGKTHISRELSKELKNIVYLDKDTLIPLSKQIFVVANQPYNRSSDFFEEHIRNYEYECVIDLALDALDYNDMVLINAPFTREIRDMEYINNLKAMLAKKGAKLVVIWVQTSPEIVHKRMIARNSDRDTWKLQNWDKYIAGCNFSIPENLNTPNIKDDLLIFKNDNNKEFEESMKHIVAILKETEEAKL
ncbi:MAG: AAA family ATPase [Acutalibacteraceae bacterium]|nr:AAA family ATPase [Acutalibacteraceae bacterium]